jgi:hypothetical protein
MNAISKIIENKAQKRRRSTRSKNRLQIFLPKYFLDTVLDTS